MTYGFIIENGIINTHFKVVNETLKSLLHEASSSKDTGKKHLNALTGFVLVDIFPK